MFLNTVHSELSDEAFETMVGLGTFPVSLFTHEAHLRLGFIHLQKYGMEKASVRISQEILQLVQSIGAADKYHHTLTIAALHIIEHHHQSSKATSFDELVCLHPELIVDFKQLIHLHYSPTLLNSSEARTQFLAPDRSLF